MKLSKLDYKDIKSIMDQLKDVYEELKNEAFKFYKKGDLEESLRRIVAVSTFAWWYHFGYWCDDELEELIKNISLDLLEKELSVHEDLKTDKKSALFLTTFLTNTGGHTEAMKLWMNCVMDNVDNIYLVSTEVYSKTLLNISDYGMNYKKIKYMRLTQKNFTEKIYYLTNMLFNTKPRYIFLFIDPNDIVSIAATNFFKTKADTKVIFFNHSDHTFWLGKNVIDILVEFRTYSVGISRIFRKFKDHIVVVPLSAKIHDDSEGEISHDNILDSLNLPQNCKTISLSIGSPWKFVDDGYWDYFKTIERILYKAKNHVHLLITKKDKYIESKFSRIPEEIKDRFRIIYNVSNPLPYYKIADFIIESFPVIGGTVRLEAMALGRPMIFIRNKRSGLFSVTDVIPPSYKYVAYNEKDIIEYVNIFLQDEGERKKAGEILRKHFYENYTSDRICVRIKDILNGEAKNDMPSLEENLIIIDTDEYLCSYDIKYRGVINPYLLLLRIYLNSKSVSPTKYFKILRRLNIYDFVFAVGKIISKL